MQIYVFPPNFYISSSLFFSTCRQWVWHSKMNAVKLINIFCIPSLFFHDFWHSIFPTRSDNMWSSQGNLTVHAQILLWPWRHPQLNIHLTVSESHDRTQSSPPNVERSVTGHMALKTQAMSSSQVHELGVVGQASELQATDGWHVYLGHRFSQRPQ